MPNAQVVAPYPTTDLRGVLTVQIQMTSMLDAACSCSCLWLLFPEQEQKHMFIATK